MNKLKKIILIGIVLIPNLVWSQAISTQGQDEDIEATSVEEVPSSVLTKLDKGTSDKFRNGPNRPLRENSKPWKLSKIYSLLPQKIQSEQHPKLSSDESGNLWVVDNILCDGQSGKILFQGTPYNELRISNNGQYLDVTCSVDNSGGDNLSGIYKVPQMAKVSLGTGLGFVMFLGQRYGLVQKTSQYGIVDLDNPGQIIKNLGDEIWGTRGVCESQDGTLMLHQDDDGMSLYSLPGFSLIKKYSNIGSGTPFINSTGTVIGCNRGDCYLLNRTTGEVKSYGMNGENCNDLVEGTNVKRPFRDSNVKMHSDSLSNIDVTTKIISLVTFKTIEKFDTSKTSVRLGAGTSSGKSCAVYYVITPPSTSDVWLVINQFNSFDPHDRSGHSTFLRVGENLKIKQILNFARTINGASWDTDSNSIVGKTFNDEYFQIEETP